MKQIKRVSLFFRIIFQIIFIAIPVMLAAAHEGIMGVVLTWHNPHGHRFAAFSLDQTNAGIVITALLVILISWIMAEGCKLREEQQLTI